METTKTLVSLVAVLSLLVLVMSSVSAFASITSVEVSGISASGNTNIAAFAGQTLPVRVIFTATANASDVRVKALISGDRDEEISSERFDVIAGGIYSKLMSMPVPTKIDPDQRLALEVTIENPEKRTVARQIIPIAAQRESYVVEILDVSMDSKVQAGSTLAVDLVLKNRGRKFSEDAFVKALIPALGIERKAYFGDLSPVDQADPDKEDAVDRRLLISIPASTPAGVYTVEFEAYDDDSSALVSKKFAVVGASGTSTVVTPSTAKSFAIGAQGTYLVTLVNAGQNVRVYNLAFDAPALLSVESEESVVAVPAGTSKTIKVIASATKAGTYPFTVSVYSDGDIVKKETFTATVDGKTKTTGSATAETTTNTTVVVTVVLAIIFIVLLVVLIVLLTRKPQKTEEFGESYY